MAKKTTPTKPPEKINQWAKPFPADNWLDKVVNKLFFWL